MTSGLVGFCSGEGDTAMPNAKTHFEQVPLKIVNKRIAEFTANQRLRAWSPILVSGLHDNNVPVRRESTLRPRGLSAQLRSRRARILRMRRGIS